MATPQKPDYADVVKFGLATDPLACNAKYTCYCPTTTTTRYISVSASRSNASVSGIAKEHPLAVAERQRKLERMRALKARVDNRRKRLMSLQQKRKQRAIERALRVTKAVAERLRKRLAARSSAAILNEYGVSSVDDLVFENEVRAYWIAVRRERADQIRREARCHTVKRMAKVLFSQHPDLVEDDVVLDVEEECESCDSDETSARSAMRWTHKASKRRVDQYSDWCQRGFEPSVQTRKQRDVGLLQRLRLRIAFLAFLREKRVKVAQYLRRPSPPSVEMQRLFQQDTMEQIDAVPEMSDANQDAHGPDNLTLLQANNVTITQAREESFAEPLPSPSPWSNMCSSDVKADYTTVLDRYFEIATFSWTADDTEGSLIKLKDNASVFANVTAMPLPFSALVKFNEGTFTYDPSKILALPFTMHRYWRGDMEITIKLNSNKFQIGQLQGSWFYENFSDVKFDLRQNVQSCSQTDHILISASSSNEARLVIPYKYHLPYLNTRSRSDMDNPLALGTFYLRVLNPLLVSKNNVTAGTATGTILIRFLNSEFTGMIAPSVDPFVASPQMDRIVNVAENLLKMTNTPNCDNPSDIRPPTYIVPTASHSWSAGVGISEPLQALRLDLAGTTQHEDGATATRISDVVSKFGLVHSFKWSADQKSGTVLNSYDAAPIIELQHYKKVAADGNLATMYYMPPVGVVSSLFYYWRGSIDFRFDVIASQFHTGSLLVGYVPGAVSDTGITIDILRSCPHMLFNLQESNSFTYSIPFVSNKPFWPRRHTGNYISNEVMAPSRLYVYVLNALVPMDSVPETIYINMYMRGGDSFELSIPVQPSVGLGFNRHVYYNTSELMHANADSAPYYFGRYHNIQTSGGVQPLVARVKATSNGISYFSNKWGIKGFSSQFYFVFDDPSSPYCMIKTTQGMIPVKYGVFIPDTGKDPNSVLCLMACTSEDACKAASALIHNRVNLSDYNEERRQQLIDALKPGWYYAGAATTSNTWCSGNPAWAVRSLKQALAEAMQEIGERDVSNLTISSDKGLPSTSGGSRLFGESMVDLKDLARRYQVYASFSLTATDLTQIGQCSTILPVMPQGLDLNLGTIISINELPNRCRDGSIPIICSGYRYFRGSIRFRVVVPSTAGVAIWIQHRPDRKLRSTAPIPCKDVTTAEAVANHGYASYLQFSSVNGIVEFEVPYYQPGSYGLLQRPKITKTDTDYYFSLGEVTIGFIVSKAKAKEFSLFPVTVYYSLADDMQLSTFQGFPPVILLDEITAVPEMGLVENVVLKATDKVGESIKQGIKEAANTVSDKISDIHKTLEGNSVLSSLLKTPLIRNLLTNLGHCAIARSLGSCAWAVCSFFMEIGLFTLDLMRDAVDCLSTALMSIGASQKPRSEAKAYKVAEPVAGPSTNPFDDDFGVEVAQDATDTVYCTSQSGGAEISDTHSAFTGFITLLYTAVCGMLKIKSIKMHSLDSWTKLITKDIGEISKSANALFSLIKNIFSVLDKMVDWILGKFDSRLAYSKLLMKSHPELTEWIKEVTYLTDPANKDSIAQYTCMQDRIHSAYLTGSLFFSNYVEIDKPPKSVQILRMFWDKLYKLKQDLDAMGIDPYVRELPFGLRIFGDPGVGKTEVSDNICVKLLDSINFKSKSNMKFTLNCASRFWDTCKHQPVIEIDDLWNITTGEMFEKQVAAVFSIMSPVVLNPPKASLEDKELRYNPKIFVQRTNKPFAVFPGIDRDALLRRAHVLIEVKKNPKKKDGCAHCIKNLTPEQASVADLADWHHVVFNVYNSPLREKKADDSLDLKFKEISMDDLIKFLIPVFRENREKESEMFARRINFENILREEPDSQMDKLPISTRLALLKSRMIDEMRAQQEAFFADDFNFLTDLKTTVKDKYHEIEISGKQILDNLISTIRVAYDKKKHILQRVTTSGERAQGVIFPLVAAATPEGKGLANSIADIFSKMKSGISFTYDQLNEIISKKNQQFTCSSVFASRIDKLYDEGWINTKMRDEIICLTNAGVISDDLEWLSTTLDASLNYIKSEWQTTSYASRDWLPFLKVVSRMMKCAHTHVLPADYEYDHENNRFIKGFFDNHAMWFNEGLCNQAACAFKSTFYKYVWMKEWLHSRPYYRRLFRERRFDMLPSFFKPDIIQSQFASQIDGLYQSLKDWYEVLKRKYITPTLTKILNFWNEYEELFTILSILLGMTGFAFAIGKISNKNLDKIKETERERTRHLQMKAYFDSRLHGYDKDADFLKSLWSDPQAGHGYTKTGTATVLNKTVPIATKQANSAQSEVVVDLILNNMFTITACWDGNTQTANCVCLRGREILMIRHFLEEFNDLPKHTKFYGCYKKRTMQGCQYPLGIEFNLLDCPVSFYGIEKAEGAYSSNIGILTLPRCFNECKDLTCFIANAEKHKYVNGRASLVQTNNKVYANLLISRKASQAHVVRPTSSTSAIVMDDVYTYPIHGRGMCGSILVADNLERPIIGLHVAGIEAVGGYGISEILTVEMFCEAPTLQKRTYEKVLLPTFSDIEFSKINLETAIMPYGVVPDTLSNVQSGETMFVKSGIHGVFPVETEPNPLKPSDRRLPYGCPPLKLGVEHMGKPPRDFPLALLDEACEDLSSKICSVVAPARATVGVVDLESAIVGIPGVDGYEPLAWNTSEGFPLKSVRPRGVKGKQWLFDLELGSDSKLILKGVDPQLTRLISLDMEMRRRGIKPFTVFSDCLKDTCIPKEKCKIPGKTRIFSISPVQFTIAFKQYFGDFMAAYQLARFNAEHAIGVNVNSMEWSTLAGLLSRKGGKIIAGDYKNFGPGLMKEAAYRAFKIILAWYETHNATAEEQAIRKIMIEEVLDCPHLVSNLLYFTPCGIPSGSPITAPLNSLVNCIYIRCAWKSITNLSFVDMYAHTDIVTYGDDVCIGISDEISEVFNTETMNQFFSEYNIVFTDADKTDQIVKFRDLSTVSFLKCKFLEHPKRSGIWLAALDKTSIQGCANWIHKGGDLKESTLENAKQCSLLAFGWGPEYYDEVCKALRKAVSTAFGQIYLPLESWQEMDKRIYSQL